VTFDAAIDQLERARDGVRPAAAEALREVGEAAASELAAASPVDSGQLAQSWRYTEGRLVNDAPYASYVEGLDELAGRVLRSQSTRFAETFRRSLNDAAGWR
jgi:hypothetical protein